MWRSSYAFCVHQELCLGHAFCSLDHVASGDPPPSESVTLVPPTNRPLCAFPIYPAALPHNCRQNSRTIAKGSKVAFTVQPLALIGSNLDHPQASPQSTDVQQGLDLETAAAAG